MSIKPINNGRLTALFNEAESNNRCLCFPNKRDVSALNIRVGDGRVVKVFRGIYARREYWDTLSQKERGQHLIRSLSIVHPTWVFSHSSAALIYGLDMANKIMLPLHYLVDYSNTGNNNPKLACHRTMAPISLMKSNVKVTSLEQTVVDCAAYYPFRYALAIADSALHQGLTDKARLFNYLEERSNRRGVRQALRVIEFSDSRADNGGESYVRALILEANLPEPDLQVQIETPLYPGHYYYADFLFTREDGVRVALELDGQEKYIDERMNKGRGVLGAMMKEREREAAITACGIQVARLSFKQASNPEVLQSTLASYGIYPIQKRRRKA